MANEQNLIPFKEGDDPRRNTNGRPKGTKNLATIMKELENEDFDWTILPVNGKKLQDFLGKMGSPWRAIMMKAVLDAVQKGNTKAMEWLRKSAYGDKLDITTGGEKIQAPLIISPIKPREVNASPEDETAAGN